MARDFAAILSTERAGTLVMDTTREGRELLTQAIRAELRKDGTITGKSVKMVTLENKGLPREEARQASGYEKGGVLTFRRDYERHGVEKGQVYRVDAIDRATNRIALQDRDGRAIDWKLNRWGRGQSEAYVEKERDFERGDRVQFTRNDRETGRVKGLTGNVTAIDAERRAMTVRDQAAAGTSAFAGPDPKPAPSLRVGRDRAWKPRRDRRPVDGEPRKPPRDDGGCQKHLCRDQSSPP